MKKLFATLSILSVLFFFVPQAHASSSLLTNLVSYWKLDGNSNDAVGSNNGTDTSVTYSTGSGKINQGINVNGGYINLGTGLAGFSTAMTLSLWVYQTGYPASGYSMAFSKFTATSPYGGYAMNNGNPGDKNWYFQLNLGGTLKGTSGTTPILNSWVHLVGVYDGSHIILYVNGTAVNTVAATGNIAYQNAAAPVFIGKNGGNGAEFVGDIDEVGIWSRALTPTEVTELYNNGAGLQYPFTVASTPSLFARIYSWF